MRLSDPSVMASTYQFLEAHPIIVMQESHLSSSRCPRLVIFPF